MLVSTDRKDAEPIKQTVDFRGQHEVLNGILVLSGGSFSVNIPRSNGSVTLGRIVGLSLKSGKLYVEFDDVRMGKSHKTVCISDLLALNPGLEVILPPDEEVEALRAEVGLSPTPNRTETPATTQHEPTPVSIAPERWSIAALLRKLRFK